MIGVHALTVLHFSQIRNSPKALFFVIFFCTHTHDVRCARGEGMMETNNTKKQINNRTKVTTSVPLSEKKRKKLYCLMKQFQQVQTSKEGLVEVTLLAEKWVKVTIMCESNQIRQLFRIWPFLLHGTTKTYTSADKVTLNTQHNSFQVRFHIE